MSWGMVWMNVRRGSLKERASGVVSSAVHTDSYYIVCCREPGISLSVCGLYTQ